MPSPNGNHDKPVLQTLRIVEVIDCVAGNAVDANGPPISIVTLSHLGEIEQPLAISYDDSKLLVTKLLQSLTDHGNKYAERLLDEYFTDTSKSHDEDEPDDEDDEDDENDGESKK